MFDVAATGSVRVSDLKKVARELGVDIKEEELQEMIKRADQDGDDEVSEQEFADFMMKAMHWVLSLFNKQMCKTRNYKFSIIPRLTYHI